MGIETERFVASTLDRDLVICPVCLDVLDDPVELSECQHVFCNVCLRKWFDRGLKVCPLDRTPVVVKTRPPNRTLQVVLDRLRIRCKFEPRGCLGVFSVAQLDEHQRGCPLNPRPECRSHKTDRLVRDAWSQGPPSRDSGRGPQRGGNPGGMVLQDEDNTGLWVFVFGVLVFVLFKVLFR